MRALITVFALIALSSVAHADPLDALNSAETKAYEAWASCR